MMMESSTPSQNIVAWSFSLRIVFVPPESMRNVVTCGLVVDERVQSVIASRDES